MRICSSYTAGKRYMFTWVYYHSVLVIRHSLNTMDFLFGIITVTVHFVAYVNKCKYVILAITNLATLDIFCHYHLNMWKWLIQKQNNKFTILVFLFIKIC